MSRPLGIVALLFAPCSAHTELASESLDRELTRTERFALGLHCAYCLACRRYRRQLVQLRRLARGVLDPPADASAPALPAEARARIKRALRDAGP